MTLERRVCAAKSTTSNESLDVRIVWVISHAASDFWNCSKNLEALILSVSLDAEYIACNACLTWSITDDDIVGTDVDEIFEVSGLSAG